MTQKSKSPDKRPEGGPRSVPAYDRALPGQRAPTADEALNRRGDRSFVVHNLMPPPTKPGKK